MNLVISLHHNLHVISSYLLQGLLHLGDCSRVLAQAGKVKGVKALCLCPLGQFVVVRDDDGNGEVAERVRVHHQIVNERTGEENRFNLQPGEDKREGEGEGKEGIGDCEDEQKELKW